MRQQNDFAVSRKQEAMRAVGLSQLPASLDSGLCSSSQIMPETAF